MKISPFLLILLATTFAGAINFDVELVSNFSIAQINQLPPVMVHLYEQLHPTYVNFYWDTVPETNASILVFTNNIGIDPGNPGQVQQIPVLFDENATFAINHSIRAKNLMPSTQYWYSIRYCNSDNWCNATLRNFRTPAQEANARVVVQLNQQTIRINGKNLSVADVQSAIINRYVNTCEIRVNATHCKYGYLVKAGGVNLTGDFKFKLFSHLNYSWEREVYYGMGFGYPLQIACPDIVRGLVHIGSLERRFTPLIELCQVDIGASNAQGDYCVYAIANTSECPELQLQNRPQGQVNIDEPVNDQGANAGGNGQVANGGANAPAGNAGGSGSGNQAANGGAVAPNAQGAQNPAVINVNGNGLPNLSNASSNAQNNSVQLGSLAPIVPGVDNTLVIVIVAALALILIGSYVFITKKK